MYEVSELLVAADYTFAIVGLACFTSGMIVGYIMGRDQL